MRDNKMWFGTMPGRMRWIPAPGSPSDVNPQAWGTSDTYLNGGAYVRHSWGSHQQFVYEWSGSSSLEAAQIMKSYRDGTYGRSPLYFINPLTYDKNVLPARWADPSMTLGVEGNSLVAGVEPEAVPTSGGAINDLPVTSVYYDLSSSQQSDSQELFIPIPEGFTLHFGAMFQATGSGAVQTIEVDENGNSLVFSPATPVPNNASSLTNKTFSGVAGVKIRIQRLAQDSSSVTVTAMTARLAPTGTPVDDSGPWIGGMGHSGCRFDGVPTRSDVSAVNGGQASYAATFVEVGSWL